MGFVGVQMGRKTSKDEGFSLLTFVLRHMVWLLFLFIGGSIVLTLMWSSSSSSSTTTTSSTSSTTPTSTSSAEKVEEAEGGGPGRVWGYIGMVTVCIGVCLFSATKVSKTLSKMDLDAENHMV